MVHSSRVSLIFGVITVVAGILGVVSGSSMAAYLKKRYPSADPLVCAFGLICSMPFLFGGSVVSKYSTPAAYVNNPVFLSHFLPFSVDLTCVDFSHADFNICW